MILIIARYELAPGKREAYLTALAAADIVNICRREKGNISYELLQSPENPDQIVVLECWQDQESLDLHSKAPHFQQMMEIKKEFGATPTRLRKYIHCQEA